MRVCVAPWVVSWLGWLACLNGFVHWQCKECVCSVQCVRRSVGSGLGWLAGLPERGRAPGKANLLTETPFIPARNALRTSTETQHK